MANENTRIRRYFRGIRRGIPNSGKNKKIILNQIREMVEAYTAEHPGADYAEIVARFGTPEQIIDSYVEEMDTPELLETLHIRKKTTAAVLLTLTAVVVIWLGIAGAAYVNHIVESNGHFDISIDVQVDIPNTEGGK